MKVQHIIAVDRREQADFIVRAILDVYGSGTQPYVEKRAAAVPGDMTNIFATCTRQFAQELLGFARGVLYKREL